MPYKKIEQPKKKPPLSKEGWEIFKHASLSHKLRILLSLAGGVALGWGIVNLFESEDSMQQDFTTDPDLLNETIEGAENDANQYFQKNFDQTREVVPSSLEDSPLDSNMQEINSEIEEEEEGEEEEQNQETSIVPTAPKKKINRQRLAAITFGLGAIGLGAIPNSNNKITTKTKNHVI